LKAFSELNAKFYPGLLRGSLFLAVLTIATFFCTHAGFCQLIRLDTVLANKVVAHFNSTGKKNFAGDNTFAPILPLLGTAADRLSENLIVEQLSASVIPSDQSGLMAISFRGSLEKPNTQMTLQVIWDDTSLVDLSKSDLESLETNSSRYVHIDRAQPKTFWERTAEPVIVVLGALLIAALFFIVRS